MYLCIPKKAATILSPATRVAGGKSGQHRVPYFLTGRCPARGNRERHRKDTACDITAPPEQVRVKTRGKSSRRIAAMHVMASLMG